MQLQWRTMWRMTVLAAALFVCVAASASVIETPQQNTQASTQTNTPANSSTSERTFATIDGHVPVPPSPLVGGGRTHLVYELYLANLSSHETTLDAIDVRDSASPADAAPLLRLQGVALDAAIQRPAVPSDHAQKRVLQGGQLAIVFVWLTLPAGAPTPAALTHRFVTHVVEPPKPAGAPVPTTGALGGGTRADTSGQRLNVDGVTVRVTSHGPRIIGAPLSGDRWLAANGPDNATGHRRALIALAGQGRISQRYAIDWIQLNEDGKTWKDDPLKNANYRCYGSLALAVADGIVADTHDGVPENIPGATSRAVPITPETLGGNYILLDIGRGAFAYYAHLQPGSLKVKKGDAVHRGQVIGLVGNSGNSTEPHLHFHLADRNAAIDSEGVPYAFDAFELQAAPDRVTAAMTPAGDSLAIDAALMSTLTSSPAAPASASIRRDEIPMLNAIVRFPHPASANQH